MGKRIVAKAATWEQREEESGGKRQISDVEGGGGGAGNEGAHQMGMTGRMGEEGKQAQRD